MFAWKWIYVTGVAILLFVLQGCSGEINIENGSYDRESIKVVMTWDAPVDLDLHLVRNGADLYDPVDDCCWKFPQQSWGDLDSSRDNPLLLFDDRSGFGPETVVLNKMTREDTYTVAVDYWGDPEGNPCKLPTSALIEVWINGEDTPHKYQVTGFTYGAPETGQFKVVCDIDGETGEVTIADRGLTRNVTPSRGVLKK